MYRTKPDDANPVETCSLKGLTYGAFLETILDSQTSTPRWTIRVAVTRDAGLTWTHLPMRRTWLSAIVAFDATWPPALFVSLRCDPKRQTVCLEFENEPYVDGRGHVWRALWQPQTLRWRVLRPESGIRWR